MSKRLEMLQAMAHRSSDPFALYALALEYAKLDRAAEALSTFESLRHSTPDYLPMYLMAGQLLAAQQRPAEAREWFTAGLGVARTQGNAHTLSELETALVSLGG